MQPTTTRLTLRRRILRVMLVILGLLLIPALWFGWYAYHVYQGLENITNQHVQRDPHEQSFTIPSIDSSQRINFLVLGSDNDSKAQELHPLAQSMIVVTVDPRHYRVGLLSIPRDFWVPIPGHGYSKLDLAYKYGGVRLARYMVEKLFGIPIHYYAWVGLNGFQRVLDTFGGINVDVRYPVLDDYYPNDITSADPYAYKRVFIPPGWRHLSGRQALEYVRSRHGDLIGDFGRSTRQQQVLVALRKKLTFMNVLTNIGSLVDDLQGSVKTDLSPTQLYALQNLSRHISSANIERVVLQAPTYCRYATSSDGQSILQPNWGAIRPVVQRMFAPIGAAQVTAPRRVPLPARGQPTASTVATPPAPTPTPGTVGPPAPASADWSSALPARLVVVKNGAVSLVNRNGDVSTLTGGGNAMPSVSPDGRYIAYVHFGTTDASDLWMLDRSTGSNRQITNDFARDVHNNLWAVWPFWSPDGKTLLYSTDRAKLGQQESELRPLDLGIWSMSPNGGTPREITAPPRGSGGDQDASSRAGSNQVLYVSWSYDQRTFEPYSRLVLRDVKTGATQYLTPASGRVLQPQIDRTGHRVTFVRDVNGTDQIIVAPLVGPATSTHLGTATVLASGEIGQPSFTPDGKWISYLRADGDTFSLYLIRPAGGTSYRVSAAGNDLDATSRPVWIS